LNSQNLNEEWVVSNCRAIVVFCNCKQSKFHHE